MTGRRWHCQGCILDVGDWKMFTALAEDSNPGCSCRSLVIIWLNQEQGIMLESNQSSCLLPIFSSPVWVNLCPLWPQSCSWLTVVEPDVAFCCCCTPSVSTFDRLCILRCFPVDHGCRVLELLHTSCQTSDTISSVSVLPMFSKQSFVNHI